MCCVVGLWLAVALLKVAGSWGLRNVSLLISPPVVERGKDAELLCKYDLQGAPLYSIKFYRGTHEFYRYSPTDVPTVKLFPFTGLRVDLTLSQDSSVVLQGVDYSLAGNISCEVSTDAPHFSTDIATKCLKVVELPRQPPRVVVEGSDQKYDVGDRLRATCTSAPAKPAPSLTWFINDEPAMTMATRWNQTGQGHLETRSVTLDMSLLPRHVVSGHLVLKCSAVMGEVYKETTHVRLEVYGASEPKHERVRGPSSMASRPEASLICAILLAAFFSPAPLR